MFRSVTFNIVSLSSLVLVIGLILGLSSMPATEDPVIRISPHGTMLQVSIDGLDAELDLSREAQTKAWVIAGNALSQHWHNGPREPIPSA